MIIDSKEKMKEAVNHYGILPFFKNTIQGFSIEEMCTPEVYFSSQVGVWEWKGPVIQKTDCAYGKFFGKKAAFVSKEWLCDFANWKRDGYDFDAAMNDGIGTYEEEYLYSLIDSRHSILSKDLKIQGGYVKPHTKQKDDWQPRKGFDRDITKLQMRGYITTVDFEYEVDKKGNAYGWGIAKYATMENYFGDAFSKHVYDIAPIESYERIKNHLLHVLPNCEENEIDYFLNKKN